MPFNIGVVSGKAPDAMFAQTDDVRLLPDAEMQEDMMKRGLSQVKAKAEAEVEVQRAVLIDGGRGASVRNVIAYARLSIQAQDIRQLVFGSSSPVQRELPGAGIQPLFYRGAHGNVKAEMLAAPQVVADVHWQPDVIEPLLRYGGLAVHVCGDVR